NWPIWVDPVWLAWESDSSSSDYLDKETAIRSFEIWRHADGKCLSNMNEFDRADVVTWLKRAISLRFKLLFNNYNLRRLGSQLGLRKSSQMQVLAELGVIRPLMLEALTQLRNEVEHEDATPPSAERCRELVEFVWYFLKSTESISRLRVNDGDFCHPE